MCPMSIKMIMNIPGRRIDDVVNRDVKDSGKIPKYH
jgi:hypothetical protein